MGPDGQMSIVNYVWKDEQEVAFDDSYDVPEDDDDDDDDDGDEEEMEYSGGGDERAQSAVPRERAKPKEESEDRPSTSEGKTRKGKKKKKDYRKKAKVAAMQSSEKNKAATVIQGKLRVKKAKAIKAERQKAVATIQKSAKKRKDDPRPKATRGAAPQLGERRPREEEDIKKRSVDGTLGEKQKWALRKQLPPQLQDEFDMMCEEDQDIVGAMELAKQEVFLKKRREKRLKLEMEMAAYLASGLKWDRFFRKPEAGHEFGNKTLKKALERVATNSVVFSQEEWDDFGVESGNLRMDSYIKSRDVSGEKPVACWWKPANRAPGRKKVYMSEAEEREKAAQVIQKQYHLHRSNTFILGSLVQRLGQAEAEQETALEAKWQETVLEAKCLPLDSRPPEGTELVNQALSAALAEKTVFNEAEWEAFGIEELRPDHFVLSEDKVNGAEVYFKPQPPMMVTRYIQPQRGGKGIVAERSGTGNVDADVPQPAEAAGVEGGAPSAPSRGLDDDFNSFPEPKQHEPVDQSASGPSGWVVESGLAVPESASYPDGGRTRTDASYKKPARVRTAPNDPFVHRGRSRRDHRRPHVPPAPEQLQYYALRKGLPERLVDVFNDLSEEDMEVLLNLPEEEQLGFLEQTGIEQRDTGPPMVAEEELEADEPPPIDLLEVPLPATSYGLTDSARPAASYQRAVGYENPTRDIIDSANIRWSAVLQTSNDESIPGARNDETISDAYALCIEQPRSAAQVELSYSPRAQPLSVGPPIYPPSPTNVHALANHTPGNGGPLQGALPTPRMYSFWARVNESGPFPAPMGMGGQHNIWVFPSPPHSQVLAQPLGRQLLAPQAPARSLDRPSSSRVAKRDYVPTKPLASLHRGVSPSRPRSAREMYEQIVRPFGLEQQNLPALAPVSRPVGGPMLSTRPMTSPRARPPSPAFPGVATLRSMHYPSRPQTAQPIGTSPRRARPATSHPGQRFVAHIGAPLS